PTRRRERKTPVQGRYDPASSQRKAPDDGPSTGHRPRVTYACGWSRRGLLPRSARPVGAGHAHSNPAGYLPMANPLDWLGKVAAFAALVQGSTVWLAVTGLSRSGKTVFITSLVHNLLSASHNPTRMPLLRVVGENRLIAARLLPVKAQRLARFPYQDNIEVMA